MSDAMEGQEGDGSLAGQMAAAQEALMAALIQTGVLGKIKAQLRFAALAVLNGESKALERMGGTQSACNSMADSTKLAYLLIDDFLRSKQASLARSQGVFEEEANIATVEACGGKAILQDFKAKLHPSEQDPKSSGRNSVLEQILVSVLAGSLAPPTSSASSGGVPIARPTENIPQQIVSRAVSPDIETPAPKETASAPLSRKNSMSAGLAADPCEDSVEYSDHSVNSSLDLTSCAVVEKIASNATGDTSEDDF